MLKVLQGIINANQVHESVGFHIYHYAVWLPLYFKNSV